MISTFPLFFGRDKALFGWYTPPTGPSTRDCAVVLCPPLGHEYMYSHRAYRQLAEALSAAGFPALRFDYYSTGDSAGDCPNAQSIAKWLDSINMAVDEVRIKSTLQRVALVGLRMGATLAATAAAERGDIDSVVLWNPCATGKSYIRQVKALAMTTADLSGKPVVNEDTHAIEGIGFAISASLSDELTKIDITHLDRRVSPHALVLSRDDMTSDKAVIAQLQANGTTVTERQFSNYAGFMLPPIHSELPVGALDTIASWLHETYPAPITTSAAARTTALTGTCRVFTGSTERTIERAVMFDHGQLFGIVTAPERADPKSTAIIFLNTGGDHHIGPHRIYVPLARSLAAKGFTTFRFDFSGLGDSPARQGLQENAIYADTSIDDLRAAVQYVRTTCGNQRVVLAGMCSGAYYAIHASHEDIPVDGIIAINPQLYWRQGDPLDVNPFWNAKETRRIGQALTSAKYWARLIHGNVDFKHVAAVLGGRIKVIYRNVKHSASSVSSEKARKQRPLRRPDDIASLFDPNVDTYLIFSQDDTGLLHFKHTLGKKIPDMLARQTFTLSIADDVGHTFMPIGMQIQLGELIIGWLVNRYGPESRRTSGNRRQVDTTMRLESSSGAA